MILECEACATRYLVDTADIGVLGRMVRCAECGHDWFATTDGATPSPTPEPVTSSVQDNGVDQDIEAAEAQTELQSAPPSSDMSENRNLPAIVPPTDHRPALVLGLGTMLLVLAVLYLVFGRAQIIALWPPAVHAYQVIGLEEHEQSEQSEAVEVPSAKIETVLPKPVPAPIELEEKPVEDEATVAEAGPVVPPVSFSLADVVVTRDGRTAQLAGILKNEGARDSAFPQLVVIEFDADDQEVGRKIHRLNPAYEPLAAGGTQPFTLYHKLVDQNAQRLSLSIVPDTP